MQGGYTDGSYSSGYTSYSSGYSGGYTSGFKRFNGLEVGIIILTIIALIGVFTWGLLANNTMLRDQQRATHIQQVLQALDQFYVNSALQPSERAYPVSVCSSNLNEVDYEWTLKNHLTGKQVELDSHSYIDDSNFPNDPWGSYNSNFRQKAAPFRCTNIFPNGSATTQYIDGRESCDFSSANNIRYCYLFTSSVNGDSFQLGYWSEQNNAYIVYSRFREDALQVNVLPAS